MFSSLTESVNDRSTQAFSDGVLTTQQKCMSGAQQRKKMKQDEDAAQNGKNVKASLVPRLSPLGIRLVKCLMGPLFWKKVWRSREVTPALLSCWWACYHIVVVKLIIPRNVTNA